MCLFSRGSRPERLSPESTTWLCKDAEGDQGNKKKTEEVEKRGGMTTKTNPTKH